MTVNEWSRVQKITISTQKIVHITRSIILYKWPTRLPNNNEEYVDSRERFDQYIWQILNNLQQQVQRKWDSSPFAIRTIYKTAIVSRCIRINGLKIEECFEMWTKLLSIIGAVSTSLALARVLALQIIWDNVYLLKSFQRVEDVGVVSVFESWEFPRINRSSKISTQVQRQTSSYQTFKLHGEKAWTLDRQLSVLYDRCLSVPGKGMVQCSSLNEVCFCRK